MKSFYSDNFNNIIIIGKTIAKKFKKMPSEKRITLAIAIFRTAFWRGK